MKDVAMKVIEGEIANPRVFVALDTVYSRYWYCQESDHWFSAEHWRRIGQTLTEAGIDSGEIFSAIAGDLRSIQLSVENLHSKSEERWLEEFEDSDVWLISLQRHDPTCDRIVRRWFQQQVELVLARLGASSGRQAAQWHEFVALREALRCLFFHNHDMASRIASEILARASDEALLADEDLFLDFVMPLAAMCESKIVEMLSADEVSRLQNRLKHYFSINIESLRQSGGSMAKANRFYQEVMGWAAACDWVDWFREAGGWDLYMQSLIEAATVRQADNGNKEAALDWAQTEVLAFSLRRYRPLVEELSTLLLRQTRSVKGQIAGAISFLRLSPE